MKDNLLDRTKKVWSEYLGREVGDDEARSILTAFMTLGELMSEIRWNDKFSWDFSKDVIIDPPKRKR